jgi:alanine racemase
MDGGQNLHSTWVEVDLDAIKNNIDYILGQSKTQVMTIVKANAYGHGSVPVAQAALEAGASWCGIARVDEALELRQAGLDCPILILGFTPEARYEEMIKYRVSMTVWSLAQIENISAVTSRIDQNAKLHLKVDTGMSRLGIDSKGVVNLLGKVAQLPNVYVEGLFTHFARADEADPVPTDAQKKLFRDLVNRLEAAGHEFHLIHAANSAASLTRSSSYFNCVRVGIAMYGLHPSAECPLPPEFKPALTWKSVLSQVKTLPPGRGISYGHEYVTTKEERIGTVPVGYADGFRRVPGNHVLIGGRKVPVVGRVTMDQIMVQLDAVPDAKEGDEVVLLGEQNGNNISAEEIAGQWNTNNYEVVSGISRRVPRIY